MDGKVTAEIVGGAAPELDNGGGDAARVIAGERDGFAVKVESSVTDRGSDCACLLYTSRCV